MSTIAGSEKYSSLSLNEILAIEVIPAGVSSVAYIAGVYFFTYFKEPGSANMVGLQNLIEYIEENKIPYAVASSSHPQAIKKFLSHAGFVLSPNVIVSSKEGYNSKPAPDVFLAAAERLDVKPENCLVLEDSKHGIMAAANAKMQSIFIQDQIAPDDEMKEYIQESCKDLNEIIDYLKRCK